MNKVCSYARVASIIMVILMVLAFIKTDIITIIQGYAFWIVWIIFFILLISNAAKNSPICLPSKLGIACGILCMTHGLILDLIEYDIIDYTKACYNALLTLSIIDILMIAATYIILSKYFSKGSTLKVVCYALAIGPLISDDRSFIGYGIYMIFPILFFYYFSRLKTECNECV